LLGACQPSATKKELVEPTTKRGYRVIERAGHDATLPAPVLFALHAYATPLETLPEAFSLNDVAAKHGFLVVVPEGTKDDDGNPFWNASRACCGRVKNEVDDLGYLRGVLGDLKRHYAVDDARVYALGVSNGAFMAHRWACSTGDLAGIVAISGVGPGPDDPPCKPERKVRVLQIHGDRDEVIRYTGGQGTKGRYPSAYATAKRWAELNGCRSERAFGSEFTLLHGRTKRSEWPDSGARVVLWTFEGGAHNLRSARLLTSHIVDFLENHP
jgi:polyhydroxybutyrate depolymerase